MRFVELEEARRTPGLRLVIARSVPSPWSQGAMEILDMKGLDYVAVRFRSKDEDIKQWTGAPNVPVAIYDDEPPRTGWAEILQLAERLGGRISLVPADDDRRVRMFGLAHELLGENGLGWCVRLLLTHAGLVTGGREGWPAPVAAYLAPRYGYAADGAGRVCRGHPPRRRAATRGAVPDPRAAPEQLRDAGPRRARGRAVRPAGAPRLDVPAAPHAAGADVAFS